MRDNQVLTGKRLSSPGGVRQYLASKELPLRGIMVEPDGIKEVKLLVVLCHGIEAGWKPLMKRLEET
eukprot:s806_g6.t1